MKYNANFRNIIKRSVVLLLSILLLLGSIPAASGAQSDEVTVVRVGYYENEVFQEGAGEGKVKNGYAYEYYRKLSEFTGWKYEYVYGSYADLYNMLLEGKIDLLAGLAYKKEREGLIGYPDARMGNEKYIFVKHSSDDGITADVSTFNGKRIGILNSSAMISVLKDYLAEHDINAEIITYDSSDDLMFYFDRKSFDILAVEGDGAYGRVSSEVLGTFGASDYYLCVNIHRPDLLKELNYAQSTLEVEEPNYLSSLNAKYYSYSVSTRAFSASEIEWMHAHDSLKVGYLNHYLPFSDTDKDGNPDGIVKDVFPKIFESLDVPISDISYQAFDNYDDMIKAINNDEIDVVFPVSGGLYYSEQNGINLSNPVVSASSELVYNGSFDEDTITNCAINENNTLQYYYFKTYYPYVEITYYPSIDACLDAVLRDEASCTILNGMRASDILRNHKYDKLISVQLSGIDNHCFGVKIGNDGLLRLLNRGLNVIGQDYAKNLAFQYSDGLFKYTLSDVLRENMLLFAVIIFLVAGLIIFLLIRDKTHNKHLIIATKKAKEELEKKNRELEQSEKALSEALIVAEHANDSKTIFLNNMSHDIRTPMNAIVGFTALAATHIDDKALVQDYLNKITVSSRHLLSLINDVLDMSRIESGKMRIDQSEVHMPDLIHDLRTIIIPNINAKQQELFSDTMDVRNEDVITDKLRLNQVLLNVLTNAIKFTPPGGTINFRVTEKPSDISGKTCFEFRVKDNGIGMSEEFQKTIFEAFTRERNSTVSGIQGTGLGMAITKNIVDMLGGKISVTSQVGVGSEFVVELPCKISKNQHALEPLPELSGLRALVADDNTDTCLSICSMLREIGMRPDWTNYGKEAVVRAKEAYQSGDRFMTYIIDWMMPDQNGIETVRRIRQVIGNSDPIIVLTAYDWREVEKEAREAGVTAFCSKPLFISELRSVLAEPFHLDDIKEDQEEDDRRFEGKRALLAEDNELNQQIAVTILEELGMEVDVASDGEQAVADVATAEPGYYDIILMDIQMPVMDGYEAAKRIRKLSDPVKSSVPIVAVTANAFEEDRRLALKSGMNGHLAKPYDIPQLVGTLEKILCKEDTEESDE